MPKRQNYNELYAFFIIAQENSFTKAAKRLGMTQSGLSHLIRELEKRLGVVLIIRTTRKLTLTHAGKELFEVAKHSFDALNHQLDRLSHLRDTPVGTVRITAGLHPITSLLLPKLAHFSTLYPDIRLELISDSHFVDIIKEGFDAGIRLGGDVDDNMVAVKIAPPLSMAVVGSPKYFEQHGFPKIPQDLLSHDCIGYALSDGSHYQWQFEMDNKTVSIPVQGQWTFNDDDAMLTATRLGLGMALLPLQMVQDDIKQGSLIAVLSSYTKSLPAMYLYYAKEQCSPALKVVIETLRLSTV